jgi:hypothetical protein
MPVITRFQLRNANAMRDRRVRLRALARKMIMNARPVCTLDISQYSESSDDDDDNDTVESEYDIATVETEYDSDTEKEEEEEIVRMKEQIEALENRIMVLEDTSPKRGWVSFAFNVAMLLSVMYCAAHTD